MNKKQLLILKLHLKKYLNILNELCFIGITESNLLSVDESNTIRIKFGAIDFAKSKTFRINFEEKNNERFLAYIQKLESEKSGLKYLWIELSNDCGLCKISSLLNIRFDFSYEIDPNGLIIMYSFDGLECLLFDFAEDESGQRYLEVTTKGLVWPLIVF